MRSWLCSDTILSILPIMAKSDALREPKHGSAACESGQNAKIFTLISHPMRGLPLAPARKGMPRWSL